MTDTEKLAWHYTTGEKFLQIVEDGVLVPSDIYVNPPERPVLWFSLNQEWEPTACKHWKDRATGVVSRLTREETHERGRGTVRFGCDPSALIPWDELPRRAHMQRQMSTGLAIVGLQQGAMPSQWMGSLSPIYREQWLAVEVWEPGEPFDAGRWVEVLNANATA